VSGRPPPEVDRLAHDSTIVLRTLADLDALRRNRRVVLAGPRTELALGTLPSDDARAIEARLNAHASNCGCNTGSIVASLALLAYAAYLVIAQGGPSQWRLSDAWWGFAVLVVAAAAGKGLGVIHARASLLGELRRLRRRLQLPPGTAEV
jgi:hypothetical protein